MTWMQPVRGMSLQGMQQPAGTDVIGLFPLCPALRDRHP